MSDKKDENNGTLTVSPSKKLSLTKTVEGGSVQQNVSRGRSKTIKVEVRRTRTFSQDRSGTVVEEKELGGNSDDDRNLSASERETRIKALESAKNAPTDKKETLAKATPKKADEPQPAPEDMLPPADVEVTKDRGSKDTKAKQKPDKVLPALKSERSDDKKKVSGKPKKDDTQRKQKLTLSQAMLGDEEAGGGNRMRSLAAEKRAREKMKRLADSTEGKFNKDAEKKNREIIIPEVIQVQELANRMAIRAVDVVRELMKLGIMTNVSQSIDADTAELLVEEFGHVAKRVTEADVENILSEEPLDPEGTLEARPPVVTIMGHVDHGKTSLLDALRETDVAAGEAGGITQHIGAYQIQMESGDHITFLDTPGHAAFTSMRARGAKVTDIVVLVVAADDGVMPQTKEAISHAKAAEVPIIVAVNKIDKPEADAKKVKEELLSYDLVSEDFGGDVQVVEVSAKERIGLDKLEEAIMLQAEVLELRANPNKRARGTVVEAKVDKGRGVVATLLVEAGTLKQGDIVVAGVGFGRVKTLTDHKMLTLKEAGPAMPVEVQGLNEAPAAGDGFNVVGSEKQAREITEYREKRQREIKAVADKNVSLEQMFKQASGSAVKELPVIIKGDVQGSVEAIIGSLDKIAEDNEDARIKVVYSGVGGITESDVSLAQTVGAIVLAFNVRANVAAKELAQSENIEVLYYAVIYDLVDDVKKALSGLLEPTIREEYLGTAEVQQVFKVSKVGKIGGCLVKDGNIKRGAGVRLIRDDVVIHTGTLKTLKRFKDDVSEVKENFECGMQFENYEDIKEGDKIEAFSLIEEQRTIE
jgi:translation initiation factor IF-2